MTPCVTRWGPDVPPHIIPTLALLRAFPSLASVYYGGPGPGTFRRGVATMAYILTCERMDSDADRVI